MIWLRVNQIHRKFAAKIQLYFDFWSRLDHIFMFHPLYLTIINKRSHYVRQTIPPSLTSRVYTLYSISTNQAIPITQPNRVFFIKSRVPPCQK